MKIKVPAKFLRPVPKAKPKPAVPDDATLPILTTLAEVVESYNGFAAERGFRYRLRLVTGPRTLEMYDPITGEITT